MTIEERKAWIDSASYIALLNKWRFEPIGSKWFQGEVGPYFTEVMFEKKAALSSEAQVAASKIVGWG